MYNYKQKIITESILFQKACSDMNIKLFGPKITDSTDIIIKHYN